MGLSLLRVSGGLYSCDTLDEDLLACLQPPAQVEPALARQY